jgi:hypothetical protein
LPREREPGYDVRRYQQVARASGLPYRDFAFEKPPITLILIEALDGDTVEATEQRLAWSQLILDLLIALLLMAEWGTWATAAYLLLGAPLIPFLYFRTDLLSVALALGGIVLVRKGREAAGGLILSGAVLAKFWPIMLAPMLVLDRRWRTLTWWGGALGLELAGWIAWAGPSGFFGTSPLGAGWQIESPIGSVIRLIVPGRPRFERGTFWVGQRPSWAVGLVLACLISLVVPIWVLSRGTPVRREGLEPLTLISTLLVLSPLVSPQYVSWIGPWASISSGRDVWVLPLALLISLLTAAELSTFDQLIAGQWPAALLVLARNLGLLALVALGIRALVAQTETLDDAVR